MPQNILDQQEKRYRTKQQNGELSNADHFLNLAGKITKLIIGTKR